MMPIRVERSFTPLYRRAPQQEITAPTPKTQCNPFTHPVDCPGLALHRLLSPITHVDIKEEIATRSFSLY